MKHLKFYISNNIESLAEHWISHSMQPLDVFKPHIILTQTQGINNWLKLKRVELTGISTNILFITPNDFLLKIYDAIHINTSVKLSNKHIDWLIYKILSEKNFQKRYPFIFDYYRNEDNSINELKLWSLAYNTADLLDQYQIYRQDILRNWLTSDASSDHTFGWQQYIWNALHEILGDKLIDLSKMQYDVMHILDKKEVREVLAEKYERISLFGISILSPYHIQMLYKLSEFIHIDFYLLNPAPDIYWNSDRSQKDLARLNVNSEYTQGHELLTNWGKVIQTTFNLLYKDDAIFNESELLEVKVYDHSTLLNALKSSIYNNDINYQGWDADIINDKSIEIASHYNPHNETVGLFNYIINLTQKTSGIKDSDVLVICSDINKYAPYIRSVFGDKSHNLKYSISDEQIINQDSIITSVIDLITFNFSEIKVDDVFKLLEHESIRNKFDISDLDNISKIIHTLNIKYGYKNERSNDTYLVSWLHGIRKCFLNICLEGLDMITIDGIEYPLYDLIDDNATIYQINQFFEFIEQLNLIKIKTQQPKSLSEWKGFIDEILQKLINYQDEINIEEYEHIINQMKQIETVDEIIGYELIPFQVFSQRLSIVLQSLHDDKKFLKRGITFCSPIPFRSVPFKVIAFLGLNAESFPRMQPDSTINYINHAPRLGDRNIKDNDKHLFLESLLAAEERFYLSYIGRNPINNTVLSPSIVIEELMDYIQSQALEGIAARSLMITQYPLNNFSHKYNKPESPINPNYLIRPNEQNIKIYKVKNEVKKINEIDSKELLFFITDPARYYFNIHKKIYFDDDIEIEAGYEKSLLDSKLEWPFLKHNIIQNHLLTGTSIESTTHNLYLNGQLPLKNVGQNYQKKLIEECDIIIQKINHFIHSYIRDQKTVNIEIDQFSISHSVEMYGDYVINFSTSKIALKHKIKMFFNQIMLTLNGTNAQYILIDKDQVIHAPPLTQSEAKDWLKIFIDIYLKLKKTPLPINAKIGEKLNIDSKDSILSDINSAKDYAFNPYLDYIIDHYNCEEVVTDIIEITESIYHSIKKRFES